MNERIKQLAEQSQKVIWPAEGNVTELTDLDVEKFAELIVRECAKIAEKEQAYNDGHEIHVNIDQCILIEFGL